MTKLFEYKYGLHHTLCELYEDEGFYFEYGDEADRRRLKLYSLKAESVPQRNIYLGHTMEEVLASGRDILGEELLKNGDPSYSEVKLVMPEITEKSYCFLGGPASFAGVTVDADGKIYHQGNAEPTFTPSDIDAYLGIIKPRQVLLDGEYPVLASVHTDGERTLEFLYFIEPGDCESCPIVWIRQKRYANATPEITEVEYFVPIGAGDLCGEGAQGKIAEIKEAIFLEALANTVAYWTDFYSSGAQMDLPEKELERVGRGAMAFATLTFTSDHPHYGHKYYGGASHDNFPPNYIWMTEAACVFGHGDFARRVFAHLINYATNESGVISYRQGRRLNLGSSAAEYGMLLFLAHKYRRILGISDYSEPQMRRLRGFGDAILQNCTRCPELEDLLLVKMCAEADNSARVNVYLNNNLWAIRGLRALAALLGDTVGAKYAEVADVLDENIGYLVDKHTERGTKFGAVPPFRFGYPTIPYNLSNCEEFSVPITREERERYYYVPKGRREFDVADQEITENTYANYRYYPEILSAMLLSEDCAEGISNMRDELGGNLLGMTRFRSWIDNWPVLNYARYLLESGKIEKYLLLLYAHTAHHGHPELMCYYEQIKVWGEVSAHDCVPSLLTTPTMLAWMFACERTTDGRLVLLGALPREWYKKPFRVSGVGYSNGTASISSDGESITLDFSAPTEDDALLTLRHKDTLTAADIVDGVQYVERIEGNALVLKNGITHACIRVK